MMRIDPLIRTLRHRAGNLAYRNPLYSWSLGSGRAPPEGLSFIPADTWPGDAERGKWLCGGTFAWDGESLQMRGGCWEPEGIERPWLEHMHGFSWLRDLRALGGDEARRMARGMIADWMEKHRSWSAFAWQPGLAGRRVANWIALYDFYGASADHSLQDTVFESLFRQARHISRALSSGAEGLDKLYGLRGLAFCGLALSGKIAWLEQALDMLQAETNRQILPDGGHVSRSPQKLLGALKIFTDIRAALLSSGIPAPEQITHTIDRMAQALRFFRYADRGMAVFNGAQEGDIAMADAVLAKSNAQGKIMRALPHTGYHRISQGRSLLMVDAGDMPAWPHDAAAHAAPLSFEFMYGKERVFVSCGSNPLDEGWRDCLRATAAHNALCLDSRNAVEIYENGHFGRKPHNVMTHRDDSLDAILFECMHDGYVPLNGITHRRRFYLCDHGHDLRGEESLSCATGLGRPVDIALRFHLHPRVLVSPVRNGQEALLRLPGGSGWRFSRAGGILRTEDSVYMGTGAVPRKTKQLVIYASMGADQAQIKWALRREGR